MISASLWSLRIIKVMWLSPVLFKILIFLPKIIFFWRRWLFVIYLTLVNEHFSTCFIQCWWWCQQKNEVGLEHRSTCLLTQCFIFKRLKRNGILVVNLFSWTLQPQLTLETKRTNTASRVLRLPLRKSSSSWSSLNCFAMLKKRVAQRNVCKPEIGLEIF